MTEGFSRRGSPSTCNKSQYEGYTFCSFDWVTPEYIDQSKDWDFMEKKDENFQVLKTRQLNCTKRQTLASTQPI